MPATIVRPYTCCDTLFDTRKEALDHLRQAHRLGKDAAYRRLRHLLLTTVSQDEPVQLNLIQISSHTTTTTQTPTRPYVRSICTCAAGQPECAACVDWRLWHPHLSSQERLDALDDEDEADV